MGRFSGKTAVVTGSGRAGRLGEAIARRLARDAAAVVLCDLGAARVAATPAAMTGGEAAMTAPEDYLAQMAARIPMRRPGRTDDTADAVAFLCSDEAGYITAESLNVSGREEPH